MGGWVVVVVRSNQTWHQADPTPAKYKVEYNSDLTVLLRFTPFCNDLSYECR